MCKINGSYEAENMRKNEYRKGGIVEGGASRGMRYAIFERRLAKSDIYLHDQVLRDVKAILHNQVSAGLEL